MTALLIIIYISFISLGLPDALLGSAWTVMRFDLSADLGYAGIISMIVAGGTIISSLFSGVLIAKFGTGKVSFASTLMTALPLLGFSFAPDFYLLCILAVPLGLGAGCIDAALNNFVALHYEARHMSWLHCFWGVGATTGPVIMSYFLLANNWRGAYMAIAILQLTLAVILFVTLPLWSSSKARQNAADKSTEAESADADEKTKRDSAAVENVYLTNREALRLPHMKLALVSFVCYCAVEATTGLWSSSFLHEVKGLSPETAALWTSYYYGGITVGRFLSGFAAMKLSSNALIRLGQVVCVAGVCALLLPLPNVFSMIGLVLIGLGCAPIYPSMLHETPVRFGKSVSQSVMGLQMAFAYVGSTFFPPLLGLLATLTNISVLPIFLVVLALMMLICSEVFTKRLSAVRA